ncbi:MAG: hypothetical protein PVH61_01815 [Candidatus Aminicenantes bacterium]|jgi:seryl-tRNA synthetase
MVLKEINLSHICEQKIEPEYFCSVISYAHPKIKSLNLNSPQQRLEISFDGTEEELETIIKNIITKIGKPVINKESEIIFSTTSAVSSCKKDTWEELVKTGMVHDFGNGHVAYKGLFLELIHAVDSLFRCIAEKLTAIPLHLPNFIQWDCMKKLGSIEEYPHRLFFLSSLVSDIDKMEEFQTAALSEDWTPGHYLSSPGYCLKTSACSLLYPFIENKSFSQGTHYTMLGMCARRESLNTNSLERLTEFQMREIVYIGDEPGVKKFFDYSIELFKDLLQHFDLTGHIATASDSFFVSRYNKLKLMLMLGQDKYEAHVLIPESDTTIAVASFNNHRNFFSKRFGFTFKGKEAVSACIGFGLERLVYAILSQHGLEPSKILRMIRDLKGTYEQKSSRPVKLCF